MEAIGWQPSWGLVGVLIVRLFDRRMPRALSLRQPNQKRQNCIHRAPYDTRRVLGVSECRRQTRQHDTPSRERT
jgi:hypothetical protein